jgi:phage recombination protein Bet
MAEAAQVATITAKNSVLVRMAERFGVDANKLHATLKATAFKGEVSDAQFMALMIVADQYGLNPLTKELYAFPDKNNGIVPVVGVDGWARILNEHPQCDGVEFVEGPTDKEGVPAWIECVIFRKDRSHPTRVREYLAECKRATGPWGSHPRRMLRHKALTQCARLAFGFVGIYDADEAERLVEGNATIVPDNETVRHLNAEITGANVIDVADTTEVPAEPDDRPRMSYAAVREQLDKAGNQDELDQAAVHIELVANTKHAKELAELYKTRRAAIVE